MRKLVNYTMTLELRKHSLRLERHYPLLPKRLHLQRHVDESFNVIRTQFSANDRPTPRFRSKLFKFKYGSFH
jgi:hypothetical protein